MLRFVTIDSIAHTLAQTGQAGCHSDCTNMSEGTLNSIVREI
jgi:hypothetical protein